MAPKASPTIAIITIVGLLAYLAYALIFEINKKHAQENPTNAIGSTVQSGNFSYKVTKFSCSQDKYKLLAEKPQGLYCLLDMTVTNTDKEPHHWHGDVELHAGQNKYTKKDVMGENLHDSINPGISVSGTWVFDVPTNITPNIASVHDALEDGINIKLR